MSRGETPFLGGAGVPMRGKRAIKAGDDLGDGLVAVPREPTEAMLRHGWHHWEEHVRSDEKFPHFRGVWRAMIAALGDRRER